MATLQTLLTIALLFSQYSSLSSDGELIDKGIILAIETNRINIGDVWYNLAPEIKDISEVFEGVADAALIRPPFRAEIKFVYDETSNSLSVKRIKIIPPSNRETALENTGEEASNK